ncbi:hypothetical protein FRC06_007880, partial [Ceratobasidium sp. 370]
MNFTSAFQEVLSRATDSGLNAYLSPDGKHLACTHTNGSVMLVDMQAGITLGTIEFGTFPSFSCLRWTSNHQFIIGNRYGEVFQANLAPLGQLDGDNLALVSAIIPPCNSSVVDLCYDPIRNLIAISFVGKVEIWCLRLDEMRRRRWILYDTIVCDRSVDESCAAALTFFGGDDRALCAVTLSGFTIWTYADRSLKWHAIGHDTYITHCVTSPDGQTMAVSTTDLSVLIWPMHVGGPDIGQQRIFEIPTGRDWQEYAESAPLTYFNAETIITADPIGNLYFLSLEGQTKHILPVGANYFI